MRLSDYNNNEHLPFHPSSEFHNSAGPSTPTITSPATNGFSNGTTSTSNGYASATNGFSNTFGTPKKQAQQQQRNAITRVNLPGNNLYDDSSLDREEFVRLVIQTLRDVGYIESAATLEAESGYALESTDASLFREYVLDAAWDKAEAALQSLGVTDEESLWEARFLITQQKYLELLEAQKTNQALLVLRNELAHMDIDTEHLRTLSSLIMCADSADLRQRAGWDGASGISRHQLLSSLQRYIPPSTMVPSRRFETLLEQARSYQVSRCAYHNAPLDTTPFSLYSDHRCDQEAFPRVTTTVLEGHADEVWNIEWSHDGMFLASASKDQTAIIWRISGNPTAVHFLRDHPHPVGCLAWSTDDTILITGCENLIKSWYTKTGLNHRLLNGHSDTVTALTWLPDGSGFISGALDRKIILWDTEGNQKYSWGETAIRITDLAVTPDHARLVVVGMYHPPPSYNGLVIGEHGMTRSIHDTPSRSGAGASVTGSVAGSSTGDKTMVVFDMASKATEETVRLEGDLSSVKISQDSQYALVNHAPNEIQLWDINQIRMCRTFTGLRQGEHIIRSCFGGADGSFVVSGSEDGKVYVWHTDTGTQLEVLSGHGEGSVNAVAWNPKNKVMFASCSDDHTIRIWESMTAVDAASHASTLGVGSLASLVPGSTLGGLGGAGVGLGDGMGESSRKGKEKTRLYWGEGAGALF